MTEVAGLEMTEAARDDAASPARQLGRVVSLAARIEPELIRAARLRLLPQLDVSAEADLWFSPLVQSRTPLAIVLRADVVAALRAELAEDPRLLDGAWDVLQAIHENAPPVLRLEEQLTWLGLRGARSDTDVDDLLRQAVFSMVDEDRSGIARWSARAFERLPQPVKRHETARMLNVGAKARLGTPIDPSETQDAPWWSWVVPSNLASIEIGVRLLDGAVEVGSEPSEWTHLLNVPKTNPPFVEVLWARDGVTRTRQVAVPDPVRPVVVVTGASEAQLRTGLGDTFRLFRRVEQVPTPGRFADFRIRFEADPARGAYRLAASGVAGETIGSFKVPFSDVELENFVLKIRRTRGGVRNGVQSRSVAFESPELNRARTFGQQLFSALMERGIGELYRAASAHARAAGQGLRLVLSLGDAPELARIPWEFLYDQPNFLSVSHTPIVRYFDLPRRSQALELALPLRILGVVSSPADAEPLDADSERRKLGEALRPLIDAGAVILDWLSEPRLEGLVRMLRSGDYHILHFIGHGGVDSTSREAVLLMEDESGRARAVSGTQLGTIIGDTRSLRLVVLNTSEGARNSLDDPFAGVAASLIERAIPAVIGMQFEITDRAMILFASELYSALAEGQPVDAAITEARLAIYADENDVEWATPVLYSRVSDGRLFDIRGSDPPFVRPTAVPP